MFDDPLVDFLHVVYHEPKVRFFALMGKCSNPTHIQRCMSWEHMPPKCRFNISMPTIKKSQMDVNKISKRKKYYIVVADLCKEQAGPFFSCTVSGLSDYMVHVVPK